MVEDFKLQMESAMAYLQNCCTQVAGNPQSETLARLFEFARDVGKLESSAVKLASGEYATANYIMQMYVNAGSILNHIIDDATDQDMYQLLTASFLVALAETDQDSCWSYGAKTLYQVRKAGLLLDRGAIRAFLAQEGDFVSNRSKSNLLNGDVIAVSLYCGRLMTIYNTLPMKDRPNKFPPETPAERILDKPVLQEDFWIPDFREQIEYAARKYFPIALGDNENSRKAVDAYLQFLSNQSDFYNAPASTKYHGSRPGDLSWHTCNVMYRTVQLMLPATDIQVAMATMAAQCHDLCKVYCYKPYSKSIKVYSDNGSKKDAMGRFDWQDSISFNYDEAMPFGHGRKSLYITSGFFGESLPEEVACAIDGHMFDQKENPNIHTQMLQNPLTLWVHMGDCIATYLDEYEEK